MITTIVISTTTDTGGEYAQAVRRAGARDRIVPFALDAVDAFLAEAAGLLIAGGGDVDPDRYGCSSSLADDVDPQRDAFEIALLRRARERAIPTLCICRGLQIANVAFGGSLIPDIGARFGSEAARLHRREHDGVAERGLIAGHDVRVVADSLLARIVGGGPVATGSRHHQSIAAVAPDLRVTATTADGIVEAAEARFTSPFWLGVQWHPESTLDADAGASLAIFKTFIAAAGRYASPAALQTTS